MKPCDLTSRDQVRSCDNHHMLSCTHQVWRYTDDKQLRQYNWCMEPSSDGGLMAVNCVDAVDENDKRHYPQLWIKDEVYCTAR